MDASSVPVENAAQPLGDDEKDYGSDSGSGNVDNDNDNYGKDENKMDTSSVPVENAARPRMKAADKADKEGVPWEFIKSGEIIKNNSAGYARMLSKLKGPGGCGWQRYRDQSKSLADDIYIYLRPGHTNLTTSNLIRRSDLTEGQDYFAGHEAVYTYIMDLLPRKHAAYLKSLE